MRQATWEDMFRRQEEAAAPLEEKRSVWSRLMLLSWEEWVTLLVVFIVFMTVVQSIDSADWVEEMPSLYAIAFGGLGVGLLLAKTRLNEAVAHVVALVVGFFAVILASTTTFDGSLSSRASELEERMSRWVDAFVNGGISNDNLPFVVMVVALTYLTAYISIWALFRWYNAWVGLIPGGLALLTNLSYLPGQNSIPLLIYLFGAILLVSRMHVLRQARDWQRKRTPYPDLLSLQVLNVTIWVAVGLLAFAWILPVSRGGGVMASVWEGITAPVAGPLEDLQRVFGAVDAKRAGSVHKFGSTLPLQGKVTLGGGQVLSVVTSEPLFLRGQTYDEYTAEGWKLGPGSQITTSSWPALKALQSPDQARREFRRPLSVQVTTTRRTNVIFGAGQPLSVSIDARVVFGPDPSDVTSIRPSGRLPEGTEYRVDGTISSATPQRLRQAGSAYPSWMGPYLQLPDSLPSRVRAKARELTAGADNTFDKASLIEQYLRTFAIDTRIPAAPPNRDSVDYFLFELQRGYFDYHASAMVVMLRSLGVPARIAVGYVVRPSDRIPDTNTYVVSEANAFSWPEVYFPGLGWVEFNPTPSEPRITRSGSDDQAFPSDEDSLLPEDLINPDDALPPTSPADNAIQDLQLDSESSVVGKVLTFAFLAIVAGTLIAGGVFQFAWQRGLGGLDYPSQVWEKTMRLGRWARIKSVPQQTPREYVATLKRELPDVSDVEYLGQAYVRSQYGRKDLQPAEKQRLNAVWKQVRNHLFGRLLRWK